jgi:hypothetical protein
MRVAGKAMRVATGRVARGLLGRRADPAADIIERGDGAMGRIELQTTEEARDQRWRKYLDRVVGGEPQALADLYDESSRLIFSIASRVLGNPADAEEITLDVYTYVWRSAAQFDSSRASVATWLIMVTRSRAIDRLRSIVSRADQSGTTRGRNLLATPVASSNQI